MSFTQINREIPVNDNWTLSTLQKNGEYSHKLPWKTSLCDFFKEKSLTSATLSACC